MKVEWYGQFIDIDQFQALETALYKVDDKEKARLLNHVEHHANKIKSEE